MFERPNPELDNALALAESDPQQAAQVLRIAASYLKMGELLPSALAYFLGDAFERAMKRPTTSRGSELLVNLHLMVNHRRPKANFEWVGVDVEQLLKANLPKGEAINRVGEIYDIDPSTVKRMHKLYKDFKANDSLDEQQFYEAEHRSNQKQSARKKS
jgi:hypothetical protein